MLSEGMVPSSCVKVGGCNGLCIECLSDKTCMKCPSGSELADGECRKKCITGYKYKAEAPYCEEICGDGLNLGAFECDDGNVLDGDGCSSNCKIEQNTVCANKNDKSMCKVYGCSINVADDMDHIKISFNFVVNKIESIAQNIKVYIVHSSLRMLSNESKEEIKILQTKNIDSSNILLKLDTKTIESTSSDKLEVIFSEMPIPNGTNMTVQLSKVSASAKPTFKVEPSLVPKVVLCLAIAIASLHIAISYILTEDSHTGWNLIETIQLIAVIKIISLNKIPSYFYSLVETAGYTIFSFSPLSQENTTSIDFINNAWPLMALIAITFGLYGLLKGLSKLQNRFSLCFLTKALSWFEFSLILRILRLSEFPLAMYCIAQLSNFSVATATPVSSIFSILVLCALIVWVVAQFLFTRRYKVHMNSLIFKQQYGSLYTKYRSQGICPYTVGVEASKKILYACAGFLFASSIYQCVLLIAVSLGCVLWVVIGRVYFEKKDMISGIMDEAVMIIVLLLISLIKTTVFVESYITVVDHACTWPLLGLLVLKTVLCIYKSVLNVKSLVLNEKIIPSNPLKDLNLNQSKEDELVMKTEEKSSDKTLDKTISINTERPNKFQRTLK